MNQALFDLIYEYQSAIKEAVQLLEDSGIPRPPTCHDWAGYNIPQRGQLINGAKYFKHGYGCLVTLPSGNVDFDFGNEGQIDGFDLWRLIRFTEERLNNYGFPSEQSIKLAFQSAIDFNEIERLQGDLYYLCTRTGYLN